MANATSAGRGPARSDRRRRTRSTLRRALAIAVACAACASTSVAFAAPTAAEKETARGLVDEGDKRTEAGDLEGALKAYRAAHAIMGVPTTGLEVTKTLAKLGRLAEARDVALEIAGSKPAPGEPRAFTDARAEADKLAEGLEPRIPSLIIDVKGGPDASEIVVRVDRAKLPSEALGLPRRVDPGKHLVTAEAPGFKAARIEITIEEGEKKPVTLRLRAATADDATTTETPGVVATTSEALGAPPLAIAGFVGGGAGFLVGALTGFGSLAKASSAKSNCRGNICPVGNEAAADASKNLAIASDIGFGVAIVGAAIGIYAFVTQKPAAPPPPPKASFTPVLTPFGAGAVVRF